MKKHLATISNRAKLRDRGIKSCVTGGVTAAGTSGVTTSIASGVTGVGISASFRSQSSNDHTVVIFAYFFFAYLHIHKYVCLVHCDSTTIQPLLNTYIIVCLVSLVHLE